MGSWSKGEEREELYYIVEESWAACVVLLSNRLARTPRTVRDDLHCSVPLDVVSSVLEWFHAVIRRLV
ncbi:hypothetical protein GW17_00014895 [Ensete ventricosum]|nr:hypothetical protein GW17_00014895 [Ensete ventricosum]RZS21874.1 hypothetical protein BHM03_00054566 [Ensete ventricosum]